MPKGKDAASLVALCTLRRALRWHLFIDDEEDVWLGADSDEVTR